MRNRIIQTAREKINRSGFRQFTVNDIAVKLGISKNTVYKYFNSKYEIISAVVDMNVELEKAGVLKALESEGSWSDKLHALMFTYVPERPVWVTEEIERFYPQEWVKIKAMRKWRGPILAEVFMNALNNGEIRSDISPEAVSLIIGGVFLALVKSSNLEQIDMTYNQAIVHFMEILYTGILANNK
ncbi:MAG: hypothetical protein CVV03_10270 [Firmicutes bacterium HGW-Firmicutes-8]|nr:MAG: hypothetical protein CVV03_10270 [Firmicutes bacterium HGW-Firmicutes-8]